MNEKSLGGTFLHIAIGEPIYTIRRRRIREGKVSYIAIVRRGRNGLCFVGDFFTAHKNKPLILGFTGEDIGKCVFLTKEDAEKALQQLQNKKDDKEE